MAGVIVPSGGQYLNVAPDGGVGFLDKLTDAIDQAAQTRNQMRGMAPAIASSGVPVNPPGPTLFSRLLGVSADGTPATDANGAPVQGAIPAAIGQAASSAGAALPSFAGGQGAPAPAPQIPSNAIAAYIGQAAQARGINPMAALKVASAEGGFQPATLGDGNSSSGPFQLHYGGVAPGGNSVAGLGDDFTKATGLDARDPSNWKAAVDFALDHASKNGWGAFHGAAKAGIQPFDGIGSAQPSMAYAPNGGAAAPAVGPAVSAISGAMTPGAGAPVPQPQPSALNAQSPQQGGAPAPIAPGPGGMRAAAGMTPPAATPSAPVPQQVASAGPSGVPPTPLPPGAVTSAVAPAGNGPATPPAMPLATADSGSTISNANASSSPGAVPPPSPAQAGGPTRGLPSLPQGLTPAAIGAMIQNPATRDMGLKLWQQALSPTSPLVVHAGETVLDPRTAAVRYASPVVLGADQILANPAGGPPIATNPGKDMSVQQIGEDQFGNKQFGTVDKRTGAVTPVAQGGPGMIPGNGMAAVLSSGKTGPDLLAALPTAMASQVKAIAEGRSPPPQGQALRTPIGQALSAAVQQYDPTFESGNAMARNKVRTDFESGPTANAITAGNTAIQHLADIAAIVPQLKNWDDGFPGNNLLNKAGNAWEQSKGRAPAVNQFNTAVGDFAGELTKFYRGAGGSEADLNRVFQDLNTNQSPTQLKAAIQQQMQLVGGKVNALQDRWRQGMGPAVADFPILSKTTQASVDQINHMSPANAPTAAAPQAGTHVPPPASVAMPQPGAGVAAQAAQPPMPQVGTVMHGFRFKGGDASSKDSWESAQ